MQHTVFTRSAGLGLVLGMVMLLGLTTRSSEVQAAGWKTYPTSGGGSVTPLVADFDGDGLHDLGHFNASNGYWSYKASNVGNWYPAIDRTLSWSEPARIKDAERGYGKDLTNFITGFYETSYTEYPIPGDYDGDLKDDPAYIYDDGTTIRFRYTQSSGLYGTQNATFPNRYASFTVFVADIDGDGRADPLLYNTSTGGINGLKSSNAFSSVSGQYFELASGLSGGKPFVVDYDNAKTDPNDKTDAVYTKGRDFLDDIAILKSNGDIVVFKSVYGTFNNQQVTITGFAQGSDTPVVGDFDGEGIKDVAVYRPGTGTNGGQFRVLKSSNGFNTGSVTTYNLGSSDATSNDTPVPGRFDTDFTTDFAVYRKGSAGPGEWHVYFSADKTDYPTNGVLNNGGTYPDPRFGAAEGAWDDLKKQCYETEIGWPAGGPTPSPTVAGVSTTPTPQATASNTDVDNDGYPGGAKIPCGWEAIPPSLTPQAYGSNTLDNYRFDSYRLFAGGTWYPANPMNEMAQTFTESSVTYKFNPRAFNVTYGNYLDPRANSILPFFKYVSGQEMWTTLNPVGTRPDLPTEHPGAIMVTFDGDQPFGVPESGKIKTGQRTLYALSGSYIYKRADFKQWLIDNRQGPLKDPRRWYNLIALAELENSVTTLPSEYVSILKDYTTFLDEVHDQIKTDYGLSVFPILTLSGLQGPSTNSAVESGMQTVGETASGSQDIAKSAPPVTPIAPFPTPTPASTPVNLITCDSSGAPTYLNAFSGSLTTWPTPGADSTADSLQLPNWRRYYREVLSQMNTTSGSWSSSQRDTWREFFAFTSIDPYYGPIDIDMPASGVAYDPAKTQYLDIDADLGGGAYQAITYAHVKTLAEAHADRMRCAAKVFWDDAADVSVGDGRGRPALVQQFGAVIYTSRTNDGREGWTGVPMSDAIKNALINNYARPSVGPGTPTPAKPYCFQVTGATPDPACIGATGETSQQYGLRNVVLYSSALITHLIMKDLMEEGWGKNAAVAYWLTIDQPRFFDYVTYWTWGDINGANMEPLMDQGDGANVFFTPTGRAWLAVAAGKSDYLPPSSYWFTSNGVAGAGLNVLKSVYDRPSWYAVPTPKP